MNRTILRTLFFCFLVFWPFFSPYGSWGAEPKVRIHSPEDGSKIVQDKNTILVTGKIITLGDRRPNVDIFFVLDVSGSAGRYAGVDFGDSINLPTPPGSSLPGRAQIKIFGGSYGLGRPPMRDLKNSILAAEVIAARRHLSQLNSQTTRAGLITFGENAQLVQPLTHDFEKVKDVLDEIFTEGPHGGTHMVGGVRLAIKELAGLGQSKGRTDAIKVQFLLTDGFPNLPIGGGKRATAQDTNLAINAARISGKAGIKIHVFALGKEALSYPRAAVGIARESGGIFTPVVRPADILAVLENVSAVGVNYVEVFNKTMGEKATHLRLAADGFFSSALPVVEGLNRIQVLARSSSGAFGRDSISIHYHQGDQNSLELDVFLEKEKSLKLEVERLGKSREEILEEINRNREENPVQFQGPPPASETTPR